MKKVSSRVAFGAEAFHSAILVFIKEPQYFTPGILRAELEEEVQGSDQEYSCTRRLVSKESHVPNMMEKVTTSIVNGKYTAVFVPTSLNLPYYYPKVQQLTFTLNNGEISVIYPPCDTPEKIFKKVLIQLEKYGNSPNYEKNKNHDRIIPKIAYQDLYMELKARHSISLFESWPEGGLDPKKHVFEDLGIAAFLILLWKCDKSTRWVDLGAGNGLLAYILTLEGYTNGYGVEMTRRKQWDIYESVTAYHVEAIVPNLRRFESVDFFIGNHPDELTLWIPVMAARSCPRASFMIIPCCAHDFSGSKFSGRWAGGRYAGYCDHVASVAQKLGYSVQSEWLRIPSTRNLALVGTWNGKMEDNDVEESIRNLTGNVNVSIRIPDREKTLHNK